MKLYFLSILLLFSLTARAQELSAEWSCPETSTQKTRVKLSFNDQGKIIFEPDMLSGLTESTSQTEACLKIFQEKVKSSLTLFKRQHCPSSGHDVCYASEEYVNEKVFQKISDSKLVSDNNLQVNRLPSETQSAADELRQRIQNEQLDIRNLNQTFSHQGRPYKVSDFDDVIGENLRDIFQSSDFEQARQFAQNYLLKNSEFLKSQAPSPKRTAVLNNLNRMFGFLYGDKGEEELAKLMECAPEDNLRPVTDLLEKIQETEKVSKCAPLTPGSHKVFQKENSHYYSTGNYLLKKNADRNYQAVLNINFTQGAGSISPEKMMKKARECMAMAAPALKGPQGQKMEILLLDSLQANSLPRDERPNMNTISIERPNHETDAASYAENVNCAVITHEILHLFGLCDEYKEDRERLAHLNWTCRIETKRSSIMRDLRAFDQAVGKTYSCDCSGDPCKTVMSSNDENLKKLFVSPPLQEVSDHQFRNSYCRDEYVPVSASQPDKAVVILNEGEDSLDLEARYVSGKLQAPYYSKFAMKVRCKCPAGDANCREQLKNISRDVRINRMISRCPYNAFEKSMKEGSIRPGFSVANGLLTIRTSPSLPSLLSPNHFHKILEGNCPGKADGYRQCAEFAYKSPPCGEIPSRCHDDNYYLGNSQ